MPLQHEIARLQCGRSRIKAVVLRHNYVSIIYKMNKGGQISRELFSTRHRVKRTGSTLVSTGKISYPIKEMRSPSNSGAHGGQLGRDG